MQLTARRRVVLAIVLSWPVGYFYLDWALNTGKNIVRHHQDGFISCNSALEAFDNGCNISSFNPVIAWAELVVVSLLVLGVGFLVARWTLRPVRGIAETVGRLGPTSLGLRMRATGPRDEVRRLSDSVDEMLDRVAEGYEAQRRFAANASHELRTPLATQRALIEVSLTGALTESQLELLSRQLLATNERNEKLIEGLLVLAETERGLMSQSPQRLDLLLTAAVETFAPFAAERSVKVLEEIEYTDVLGEAPLLERLVGNLVQNAIKYNEPGGWVRVFLVRDGVLSVSNSGPLVAPDQVAGLFEPFRRASGDRLDHGGGVGLGLTIARSIVAAHSGSIVATANREGGLTVEVRLRAV